MALNLGLSRLSLGGGGGSGIQSLTMTGAVSDSLGSAVAPGNHAAISVGFPSGVTAWSSQAWGTSYGDSTYGTGASPTDYTAGDGGNLYWEGLGDDGNTYRSIAGIRYAAGTASAIADGQTWVVDDTSVNINAAASGANLTFSYAITGVPSQITINSSSGAITGTVTYAVGGATGSGTATITATDQYGRTYTDTFTWTYDLRTQATIDGAPDLTFVEDAAISAVDLTVYFVTNGNTLTYTAVDTLPTGLSLSTAGSLTGTPTTITADANYTTRGTDEYGRATDLEVPIEITGAPIIAFASFTEGTDTGALTTTSPSDGTWEWVTVTDGGATPSYTSGVGWTGANNLESGSVAVGASGADVEFNTTATTGDGARDLYVVQDASGSVSNMVMQDFIADNTAPTLSSATPADNATDVAIDVTPALTFSEDIFGVSGKDFYLYDNIDTTPVLVETFTFSSTTAATGSNGGSASISGAVITVTPGANLDNSVQHSIRWEAGAVQDAHRNDVAANTGDTAYNFTTIAAASGITVVGTATYTIATGTGTETKALPGTPAENDIVLVYRVCDFTGEANYPAVTTTGYTNVVDDIQVSQIDFALDWKRLGASPDSNVELPQADPTASGGQPQGVIIRVLRGVDTTTAIEAGPTGRQLVTSGTSVDPSAITTLTNDAMVIACAVIDDYNATGITPPTGYSEASYVAAGGSTSATASMGICSKIVATAGSEDPGSISFSGVSADRLAAYSIALKPA